MTRSRPKPSRAARFLLVLAVPIVLAPGAVVAAMAVPALAGSTEPRWVKAITGSQEYGFDILWSDGRRTYTPTRSEALAECGEYDTRVERVACRAETRTGYRWMGITKRSLRHAH